MPGHALPTDPLAPLAIDDELGGLYPAEEQVLELVQAQLAEPPKPKRTATQVRRTRWTPALREFYAGALELPDRFTVTDFSITIGKKRNQAYAELKRLVALASVWRAIPGVDTDVHWAA